MLGKSRYLAIAFVFAAVFGAVLYLNPFTPEVAADKQVWISIDELELATVQREMGDAASNFDIDVSGVTAGIAIARVNSDGLAAISDQMHISFRKCGGYVLHPTQENAFAHVEKVLSAKDFERIGGYSIDNQANVDQLLPQAVETNIRQTISDLEAFHTRRHDQPTGLESAQHIKDAWDAIASQRADVSVNTFNHTSSPQPSVILTIQGAEFPAEYVVLGAHQDSIRTGSGNTTARAPGADDDASGIASLTEAIRILVESGFTPDRTVQFMAYAAEEVGLRGSNEIATQYSPANSNINVIGALQLDMTNFKGSPTVDVSLISDSAHTNSGQNQFVSDLISEYLPNLTVTTSNCGYGCSDHASWSANGFPASFPFEAPFGQHNGQIHRAGDTLTQSGGTADHAVKFTRIALAYVGELAKGTIPEAPSSGTRFDFDGDSKTDVSIFRPGPAEWWYLKSSDGGNFAAQFGTATDTLSPADYTGDGKTDIAFFRPGTSEWFVLR
ncbi:MAG: M20/M25/M40 family metallo-hydrolase, partial [Pyrinomonadaceae bacterium]|nr:M20/M25/M40 family metallo-hydrolase [Pyrinomonadaceae bacterium]